LKSKLNHRFTPLDFTIHRRECGARGERWR